MSNLTSQIRRGYSVVLDHVTYHPPRFQRHKPVLDNVSLRIEGGDIVAIIGDNGSGKSSLLAAMAGELPDWDGNVFIENAHITAQARKLIDGVGIVHQDESADLISHLSIAANIYVRKLQREYSAAKMRRLDGNEDLLKEFRTGLADNARRLTDPIETLVAKLSGGQRQLLNAAIAIYFENQVNPCKLLLLDEHTARLSARNASEVLTYILTQVRSVSCTVVMVTHKFEEIRDHCNKLVIVKEGKIPRCMEAEEFRKLTTDEIKELM